MLDTRIRVVFVEHQFPKRDLPGVLQRLEEWLALLLMMAMFLAVGVFRDYLVPVFAVFLGLVIIIRIWKAIISWQTEWQGNAHPADAGEDQSRRLVCYGHPLELQALREPPPGELQPTEFRRRPTRRKTLLNAPVAEALSLWDLGALLVILGLLLIKWPVWVILVLVGVASLIKMALSAWFVSSYRVSGRQLEVLRGRYRAHSDQPKRIVPLADARVVCRFHSQRLTITPPGVDARSMEIDLASLRRPHAFAAAIFQAALGPQPTPGPANT